MAITGTPTPGDDFLIGDEDNNQIDALAGNDSINGVGGDDTLLGNLGDDTLTGRSGNDTLDGGVGDDEIIESGNFNFILTDAKLTVADLLNKRSQTDTLISIEQATLTGSNNANVIDTSQFTGSASLSGLAGNDTLIGEGGPSGVHTLDGGPGNDTLIGEQALLSGGEGNDLFIGKSAQTIANETGNVDFTLTDTTLIGNGTDTLRGIRRVFLKGGADSNTLDASAFTGFVRLDGADGDDILKGSQTSALSGGVGLDTLIGGTGLDKLSGNSGDDRLDGAGGNDQLIGGSGIDTLNGGEGNDDLRGEAGNDILNGDSGTDSILIDLSGVICTLSDTRLEMKSGGLTETDTLNSIEEATLIGLQTDNTLVASNFSGIVNLAGRAGNDVLAGGSGNDLLDGGAGRDFLNGGAGQDSLIGFDNPATTSEQDFLSGGAGSDTFILGRNFASSQEIGYSNFGNSDFAVLTDFNTGQVDKIRVGGSASEYQLDKTQSVNFIGSAAIDTRIFRNNELIAVVQDNVDVIINRDFIT